MIKKLHIKNFQSHKDSVLELTAGLNVITGTSDSGKSAIIRAVELVRTNRPRGTSYIRQGSKGGTSVEVTTDLGTACRKRSGTTNQYLVDGEELNAVGADVPAKVLDVLLLDDINIHNQLDSHFMLLESPGKVAKVLQQACRMENAEEAIASVVSSARSMKTRRDDQGEKLHADEETLKGFFDTENFSVLCDKYDVLMEQKEKTTTALGGLLDIIRDIKDCESKITDNAVPEIEDICCEIEGLVVDLDGNEDKAEGLLSVVSQLGGIDKAIGDVGDVVDVSGIADKLEALDERRCVNEDGIKEIQNIVGSINDIDSNTTSLKACLIELQAEESELLSQIDACPLCEGAIVDDDMKDTIIKNYGDL